MLSFFGGHQNLCNKATRRDFLAVGGFSFGMGGLSLASVLRAEDQANAGFSNSRRHKSLINIFLAGGPPHQDLWDLKPDAPSEIR